MYTYAEYLAKLFAERLGTEDASTYKNHLLRAAYRLPAGAREDFLSLVALEFLEEDNASVDSLKRITDRVRKRLIREVKRKPKTFDVSKLVVTHPDQDHVGNLKQLLDELSPLEVVILDLFLENQSVKEIAETIELHPRKAYRVLKSIREKLEHL